jgi:hypothetical protein
MENRFSISVFDRLCSFDDFFNLNTNGQRPEIQAFIARNCGRRLIDGFPEVELRTFHKIISSKSEIFLYLSSFTDIRLMKC